MNQALNDKIRTLPREEFYLLTCEKAVDLSLLLKSRYNLDNKQIGLLYELVASLYLKELRLADLYSQVKLQFGFTDSDAKRFSADLAGYKLLAIDQWLGENVIAYIQSLGLDAGDYRFEVEELKRLAAAEMAADDLAEQQERDAAEPIVVSAEESAKADEAFYSRFPIDALVDESDTAVDAPAVADANQVQDLFANHLEELLMNDDNFFISNLNQTLIQSLIDDETIKTQLIGLLTNSQLQISAETIVLDGRQVPGTVGNWIRSFINSKGSIMIDSVILTDFLVTATNARFLTETEKLTLGRLLRLYSNIKFFPDSLQGDDPEQWVILPLSISPDLELIPLASNEHSQTVEAELNAATAKQIAQLQEEAKKYPEASLERMALEEEIKRIA